VTERGFYSHGWWWLAAKKKEKYVLPTSAEIYGHLDEGLWSQKLFHV
jgi:hypothetical protein